MTVPGMMYGFGDGPKPRQETVDLVEVGGSVWDEFCSMRGVGAGYGD